MEFVELSVRIPFPSLVMVFGTNSLLFFFKSRDLSINNVSLSNLGHAISVNLHFDASKAKKFR